MLNGPEMPLDFGILKLNFPSSSISISPKRPRRFESFDRVGAGWCCCFFSIRSFFLISGQFCRTRADPFEKVFDYFLGLSVGTRHLLAFLDIVARTHSIDRKREF